MITSGGQPPFFIVAVPRSGTTLLRILIDRHPAVAIPPESHFIPRLFARRGRYGRNGRVTQIGPLLKDLATDRWFKKWELPVGDVRKELNDLREPSMAQVFEAVFRAYARREGKPRWGDKTPIYLHHVPLLSSLFPDARFIHLVRDGRDVALSLLDWDPRYRGIESAAYAWARGMRKARIFARQLGSQRFVELQYERMVEDPEGTLRQLCGFLDLSFDPVMLEHDGRVMEKVPAGERRLFSRLASPPTQGLRDWRQQMTAAEVSGFEAVAGSALIEMGYEARARCGLRTRMRAWTRVLGWGGWMIVRSVRRRLTSTRVSQVVAHE